MQIQTIKCRLSDAEKIKKKQVTLIIYSFTLCTASGIQGDNKVAKQAFLALWAK